MSVVFGARFLFDITGDIPARPRESGNYGKKLLPTRNSMLTTNICPTLTHPPRKALRKACGRSAQVFHLHYVGLHLVVRLWSLVWVTCGLRAL